MPVNLLMTFLAINPVQVMKSNRAKRQLHDKVAQYFGSRSLRDPAALALLAFHESRLAWHRATNWF